MVQSPLQLQMTKKSLLSALTMASFGLGSKAFLNYFCADVKVVGLPRFLDQLEQMQQRKGKGMLTLSNHISSSPSRLDDPLVWGVLPASYYLRGRAHRLRWALGASDTCFNNPVLAAVLRRGQVIETFRGRGVRQKAVDKAIELLDAGEWVHIFPEGLISHPPHSNLRRLKWGIGRILAEVNVLPTIIPIWLTGFDEVSVETSPFARFIPRSGKNISISFGELGIVEHRIDLLRNGPCPPRIGLSSEGEEREAWMAITQVVQEELENLGGKVSSVVTEGVKEAKGKRDH